MVAVCIWGRPAIIVVVHRRSDFPIGRENLQGIDGLSAKCKKCGMIYKKKHVVAKTPYVYML